MDNTKEEQSYVFRLMQNKPLLAFFAISYLGSWIVSVPFILSEWGIIHGDMKIFFVLKAFAGPFLAALLINYSIHGKESIKMLRAQIRNTKVKPIYFVIALAVVPVLILTISLFDSRIRNSFLGVSWIILPKYFFT